MSGVIANGLSLTEYFNGEASVSSYDFVVDLGVQNPNDAEERYGYFGNKGRQIEGGIKEADIADLNNRIDVFSLNEVQDFASFRDAMAFKAVALMHEARDRAPPTNVNGEDLEEIRGNLDIVQSDIGLDSMDGGKFERISAQIDDLKHLIDDFSGPNGETLFNNYIANLGEAVNQSDDLTREQKQGLYEHFDAVLDQPSVESVPVLDR
ncbi:MAG: hypothetical protein AAF182_02780 [Pseudomonadota bacterium]